MSVMCVLFVMGCDCVLFGCVFGYLYVWLYMLVWVMFVVGVVLLFVFFIMFDFVLMMISFGVFVVFVIVNLCVMCSYLGWFEYCYVVGWIVYGLMLVIGFVMNVWFWLGLLC